MGQESQAILLKTDRILTGEVRKQGDKYEIQVAPGSRVSLPAEQVVHVADSAEGIYEFKRDSIQPNHGGDNFQLARWCLKNDLLLHAATHYQRVAELYPGHPSVKQLAVELKDRVMKVAEFRAYLGLPEEPEPRQAEVRLASGQSGDVVTTAGFQAATMHPEIAAHFSRRIQPILMNRCSQAACHGATSQNGLKIIEPYAAAYDRISSQNLKSVLGFVEMDSKKLSPLLRYATQPHGIQRQPGISITETQLLQELTNWIEFVQNPVTNAVAHRGASLPGTEYPGYGVAYSSGSKLMPVQPGASGLRPVPQNLHSQFPNGDVPIASEIDALDQQLRQILGEETSSPRSTPAVPSTDTRRDAFDPRRFNQSSHPSQ